MIANNGQPGSEFLQLGRLSGAALEGRLRHGHTPPFEQLEGWAFRGYNVGWPPRWLGIQRFVKVFYRSPQAGLEGENWQVEQTRENDAAYVLRRRRGAVISQGAYRVLPVGYAQEWPDYPQALIIDYSLGSNPAKLFYVQPLRDLLVQIDGSDPDLLLGKAYFKFGPVMLAVGYFLLERFFPFKPGDRVQA
jgi:hypothetical protein